ncbi:MAG: hypothetical protein ACRDCE_17700, partial [Cetobacterium sp.]|uniref:hypothetical protein n=1 Tax=Cetobacterium sp. TaxID=2071632 RepID=UPI003EE72DCE
ETGFIAQEVEKYLPDAVGENSDGLKHLKPYALIAHLTNAIQEQQKQINKLTKQVNKLRKGRK